MPKQQYQMGFMHRDSTLWLLFNIMHPIWALKYVKCVWKVGPCQSRE